METKPTVIESTFENIPEELKKFPQFVVWKYIDRDGKWAKVPCSPSGEFASVTNKETWSTFEQCVEAMKSGSGYEGIGFVFSEDDPYVGVDIDKCIIDGEVSDKADALAESLASYAELSPSGTGLHVICKGDIPSACRGKYNGEAIEIYAKERYFTCTGSVYNDYPVVDRSIKLKQMVKDVKAASVSKSLENTAERKLQAALTKPHIKALFDGDLSEYDGDQSRGDLALVSKLLPYANNNQDLLDQMFRRSALYRPKWDEYRGSATYGELTLSKIITGEVEEEGEEVLDPATRAGRKSGRFTIDSMWDKVMAFRENGEARGFHPGWTQLEKLYRPTLGALSILVGTPSSGKSTFIDALAFNMAKLHKWRITMASFESLPIERHINNLIHLYLQKPTYTFLANHATDKEMEEARKQLNDWFNFIAPVGDDMTVDTLLKYVQDDIDEYGVNGFVLDPWTELEIISTGGSDVKSIEKELRKVQQFTRERELHTWLLVHPTKTGDTYKQEEKGTRPTLYSASGAAHFRNKADYGLVIQRWDDDTVTLYVDKVRNNSSGAKGSVDFNFSLRRREYTEIDDASW